MLLKTLRDEQDGRFAGDALVDDLRSLSGHINYDSPSSSPLCGANKSAKDLLNSKEQLLSNSRMTTTPKSAASSIGDSGASTPSPVPKSVPQRISDRVPLMCRANSVKRAMRNVMEHTKLVDNQQKRSTQHKQPQTNANTATAMHSTAAGQNSDHLCVITSSSSETTPWSSPCAPPSINLQSPAVSTTQLTCLSPLPDLRRDSMDEYFFNSLTDLPVPKEFADSRRGSANVPLQQQQHQSDDENNPIMYGYLGAAASKVSANNLHAPSAVSPSTSTSSTTASTANASSTTTTFPLYLTPKTYTQNMTTTNTTTTTPKTTSCASPNRNRSSASHSVVPVVEAAPDPLLRQQMCHVDYLVDISCMSDSDPNTTNATHLMPAEAFERQQLHKQQQHQLEQHKHQQHQQQQRLLLAGVGAGEARPPLPEHAFVQHTTSSATTTTTTVPKSAHMLQVPSFVVPVLEIQRPPVTFNENVYVSDSITIIDTDLQVNHQSRECSALAYSICFLG